MNRAALLLMLLAACSGDGGPGPDPGPGRILFTRLGTPFVDIYAMDLNGQNVQQLTTSLAIDADGAWSPDTFKIVFQSDRIPDTSYTPKPQIFTMNSDGSSVSQLTFPDTVRDVLTNHVKDTTSNYTPAWSPDGTKIVFSSSRDTASHVSHLYVMDPNGANVVQLTNAAGDDALPAWSPDGTKIAFASTRDGNDEIYVMNANGSGQVNLTNDPGSDLAPTWSPDGTKIAFHSDREINYAIWVMNADGSNPVRLTNPSRDASRGHENPSWSPDGTRILFDDNEDLWVMNADGSNRIRLNGSGRDILPRWRPIQ
jgi:Tol biopolymer transport system component